MATLSDGVTTITIPDDLVWIDEFDFSPVSQSIERTIGGSFIVDEAPLLHGRPVTLQGGEFVWMTKQTLVDIQTLASVAGKVLTLTLADGQVLDVIFRRDNGNPFSGEPVRRKTVQENTVNYRNITLRFYTVEVTP